jgi:chromosome segregation and condensation protein ScpB
MTEVQRNVLKQIAKYQLDNPQQKGIRPKALLAICENAMLAHSNTGLKELLNEAKDHKVVLERTDEDGQVYFYMSYSNMILEKIWKDQLNK